jgi:hypothetical protein
MFITMKEIVQAVFPNFSDFIILLPPPPTHTHTHTQSENQNSSVQFVKGKENLEEKKPFRRKVAITEGMFLLYLNFTGF